MRLAGYNDRFIPTIETSLDEYAIKPTIKIVGQGWCFERVLQDKMIVSFPRLKRHWMNTPTIPRLKSWVKGEILKVLIKDQS